MHRSKRGSSTARTDAFAGSEREEKTSARSGWNDTRFVLGAKRWVGGVDAETRFLAALGMTAFFDLVEWGEEYRSAILSF
jgi:hypothetical protein